MLSDIEKTLTTAEKLAERRERGTVAEAFSAQDLLRGMVAWHQQNEAERLPTALLAMLCAARRVC